MPYKSSEDKAKYARRYYEANKEAAKQSALECNRKIRRRARDFVRKFLSEHPCVDCGISDIRVLEFDHVRGKKDRPVTDLVRQAYALSRVVAEIEKCEVRCANCHRIKSHNTVWARQVSREF